MSNTRPAAGASLILAVLLTFAAAAPAASGQPDPEPIDRQVGSSVGGGKTGLSRGTDAGRPRSAAVHRCRFRIDGLDRNPIASLGGFDGPQVTLDPAHGAILPVGNPAPLPPLTMPFLEPGDPGLTHLKLAGTGGASCRRWAASYGRSADFRVCASGQEWTDGRSVY